MAPSGAQVLQLRGRLPEGRKFQLTKNKSLIQIDYFPVIKIYSIKLSTKSTELVLRAATVELADGSQVRPFWPTCRGQKPKGVQMIRAMAFVASTALFLAASEQAKAAPVTVKYDVTVLCATNGAPIHDIEVKVVVAGTTTKYTAFTGITGQMFMSTNRVQMTMESGSEVDILVNDPESDNYCQDWGSVTLVDHPTASGTYTVTVYLYPLP
ncbi:MAG TPA: hypothetical protein VHR66_15470 [Gemmataceae bacterium]|nr:hypothetical protein [Gemmataceae bacterium]